MNFKRFWSVMNGRNKEFIRDTGALAWNFIFPVVVVFGFAFAFSSDSQNIFKVGLVGSPTDLTAEKLPFAATHNIQFVNVGEGSEVLANALGKLQRHQYDLLLQVSGSTNSAAGPQIRYWTNSSSPKGSIVERLLLGSDPELQAKAARKFQKQTVEGREIRYVDWLISGLLALNISFSALFGVGYTIVRYRKNQVLKRLKATPLTAFEFLSAQVVSRMILILITSTLVYLGCHLVLHFQMLGSYWTLLLVLVLGAMCLISLGLLVAARISSEEVAGGVLNLITWPMMFLSGVWFSLEGAHPWVKRAANIFPLTHVIDSARAVMTEGASLAQISPHLIVLAAMTLVFLIVGSFSFRWE